MMNSESWKQLESLLPTTYVKQASEAIRTKENLIRQLLQHKKLPVEGWDDQTIEMFLTQISSMDSNNFPSNCGLGEREGRIASNMVARRHFNLSHGMGRSGDLTEAQPKAAGSSLLVKLTNHLLSDLFSIMGIQEPVHCLLVPVATSMSLTLTMLSLRADRPAARYVVWSRIDQKACFKSICSAGLQPVVVDQVQRGEQLVTDVEGIRARIVSLGSDQVLCVMTTTSCFAPRACDSIAEVAELCRTTAVPHLVNNAYGLQSYECMHRIQRTRRRGAVDVFVQSTDKNLMVPVGGSIVACFDRRLLAGISGLYAGRASASPLIDCFITLLALGRRGYESLVKKREEMYNYLHASLSVLARKHGETVLSTPDNPISLGFTVARVRATDQTRLGSMLFLRHVSGTRVVTGTHTQLVCGHEFAGWGAHCARYPTPYLTCAAAIGITSKEIDSFIARLDKVLTKIKDGSGRPPAAVEPCQSPPDN